MRLELTGRHVDITPALRRLVDTKLGKLDRLLNDRALSAQAVLTLEKRRHRAEITLHARGETFLHAVGDSANWESSITTAIAKISQQAQKVKGKWQARKRQMSKREPTAGESRVAVAVSPLEGGRPKRPRMPRIMRALRQTIRPMSVRDAAKEIDIVRDGVVIFRDPVTSAVNVLYRRPNGELTLVETEA